MTMLPPFENKKKLYEFQLPRSPERLFSTRPDILETTEIQQNHESDHSAGASSLLPTITINNSETEVSFSKHKSVSEQNVSPMMGSEPSSVHHNVESDNFILDEDDSEDDNNDTILGQFESYFRRKIDAELFTFQDNMHAMLTEQQVHFHNILRTTQVNPGKALQDSHPVQTLPESELMEEDGTNDSSQPF